MKHTSTPVTPVAATEPGALDGFEWTCSCGEHTGSSLRQCAENDRAAHQAWHAERAGLGWPKP